MVKRLFAALSLSLLIAWGCGSSSNNSPSSPSTPNSPSSNAYLGTQSPGDLWTFSIGNGSFSANNAPLSLTFSGATSTLTSGFTKLTVNSTSASGSVSVGSVGYAYEFPNTAFVMKPPANASDTLAVFGTASASYTYTVGSVFQWIVIPSSVWDSTTSNAMGAASITSINGSSVTMNVNEFMLNGTQTTTNATNTMTNQGSGKMTGSDGTNTFTFQTSSSGSFMGDVAPPTPTTLQVAGFFGMSAPGSPVNLTNVVLSGKEFRGIVFRNNAVSNHTELVWARGNNTYLDAGTYSNIDAGTESSGVSIGFGSQPSNGVVAGGIYDGSSHTTTFLINQVGGKYLIYGISTDGSSTQPYNLMLMER